ncbi:putative RING-H2 finger protein ATL53 [Bienertia sinuspersici]
MDNIYDIELFYVAGIGLFLNLFLFAITLLIYLCKPRNQNTDLESLDHLQYHYYEDDHLNVALLHENDDQRKQHEEEEKGLRLINLIPAMKFIQVSKDRELNCINGCSICLGEGYEDEEMCKVLPECNHVFHSNCIDQWLKKKQSCPVCRKIFRVVLPKI